LSGDEGQKEESISLAFESVQMSYWDLGTGTPVLVASKTYNTKTNIAQ
jgi:type VI protein secretion system component Hcp